jgi:enoyl-CoA hydratase
LSADRITAARQAGVAHLAINRPEAGNAVMGQDLVALAAAVRDAQRDPEVRVIVISGSGPKFFCTGSDISELSGGVPDIGVHLGKWHDLVDCLEASEKPVIAALNGLAVGGGLEIALACHRRIAADTARIGLPELKVGLFPAAGGVRRLTRLIGAAKALDLVLGGDIMPAAAAQALGIVDQVVPAAELASAVDASAQKLAGYEPNAVRATLMCARTATLGVDTNELEATLLRECYADPRNREVLQSFLSRPKAAKTPS